MTGDARRLRKRRDRRQRAAAMRLEPIRGRAGRRLGGVTRSGKVVGLHRFAEGMAARAERPAPPGLRRRVTGLLLAALPAVVVIVWVVARLTRHL